MSKNVKILIAVILVILVIVLCCTIGGKKDNTNTTNETITNDILENDIVENEVETNTVANEIEENDSEEKIIENVLEVKPQGTVYESNSDIGTTDKKQEAINLVKQKWGEDNSVTFRCDSINSSGEYIIAVVSKESASVKNYFKVNLDTQTVEIDY